jgi:alanyl-tRNA synthetase
MSAEEIARVETLANDIVLANTPVRTRLMAVDDAIASGALALFGEKYGEEVRVVAMGPAAAGAGARSPRPWSVELCGGTHVSRTGDIGLIAITGEQGVAAGVRRIEALTGPAARGHLTQQDRRLREVAALVKAPADEVARKVAALVEERRSLERQVSELRRRIAMGAGEGESESETRTVAGIRVIARIVEGVQPKDLRALVDAGKRRLGSGVVAIVGLGEDGKAGLVVGVTDDLTAAHDAVELVRRGAAVLGGKGGGGRADLAQAGGPDGARAAEALDAIRAALGEVTAA